MSRLELLPSAGQMYIYKLGTECDGAQMRVSDVYIPTLVALLGLCFDPSECFWDLRIWSRVVGNKSGKLRYVSQIVTHLAFTQPTPCTLCQSMKSPHMHTGLAATLPWLVHHYVPTIHLPSTSGNIPHCTCTCAPAPSLAALPHLDVPVQPCFPLPGGILTTNQP